MKRNWCLKLGLALLVLGCGPLLLFGLIFELGLMSDPDPNPMGLGLLAFLTFWPGLILTIIGLVRSLR